MYRAGVEGILGIRREGAFLVIEPCIPDAWPGFEAKVNLALTLYRIRVVNPSPRARDNSDAAFDGSRIHNTEGLVRVPLDGGTHSLFDQRQGCERLACMLHE
jgi:cyclic beta-1,2-glucan synthetase